MNSRYLAPCRAEETKQFPTETDEHVHACTGPLTHDGPEHLCECGEWWRPAVTAQVVQQ